MKDLADLVVEYKASLRMLKRANVKPILYGSMCNDTQWAICYMETGHIPESKWKISRWSKKDREVLFDPHVLDKCFTPPSAAPEVAEGIKIILNHLLSCLSQREREAFVLVKGQGFTHARAAEYMGLSRGNVYNLLKRAEKKFGSYRQFVGQKQVKDERVC